ncbi:Glucan endo-1 [Forsythia ovata]|uniref:Glucan endo-1 n=1 Tax=Forsythia ovata TaxID=205694 RepID=A0ABD1U8K2_9LAMI
MFCYNVSIEIRRRQNHSDKNLASLLKETQMRSEQAWRTPPRTKKTLSAEFSPEMEPHLGHTEDLTVCLFALFNENKKFGPTSERNFSLFYLNEKKVYIDDHSLVIGGEQRVSTGSSNGQTWCLASGVVFE